jgi:unsaturated rhamnogalacturonyl hydrolase
MNTIKKNVLSVALAAAFIPAAMAQKPTVTLDYYFNHEFHKNAAGEMERFHYIWEEKDLNGYSNWGDAFIKYGAQLKSLETAPNAANLKGTDIYIVVDPDNAKETAKPNIITPNDAKAVAEWVKAGGVLVIMANDSANVNLPSANVLAGAFGLHFNDDIQNHVIGNEISLGTLMVPDGHPIFTTAKKIYLKDMSSITLSGNAKSVYTKNGAVLMAMVKYGKGTVFAVGDPWLYNEYTNGHLPAGYDNDKALDDLSKWLVAQIPKK